MADNCRVHKIRLLRDISNIGLADACTVIDLTNANAENMDRIRIKRDELEKFDPTMPTTTYRSGKARIMVDIFNIKSEMMYNRAKINEILKATTFEGDLPFDFE